MVERIMDDGTKVSPLETAKTVSEDKTFTAFQEEYGAARPKDRSLPIPIPEPQPRPRPFRMDDIIDKDLAIDSIEKLFENKNNAKEQRELERAKPRLTPHSEQEAPKQTPTEPEAKESSKLQTMKNLFLPLKDILK